MGAGVEPDGLIDGLSGSGQVESLPVGVQGCNGPDTAAAVVDRRPHRSIRGGKTSEVGLARARIRPANLQGNKCPTAGFLLC